ncbi:MAG: M15 family metallopeptidase [Christensenella sp.]|uniref:M15 family metallopeptidase n=1 Tax=Christensenella sp. TaxID=1935934 RepID=UPI002B1F00BD|nr:M15 family metallopeptidase [Christensenella sp.]MEA5003194.1 M15 family metallopeptidase [Christensenella sp.]
MRLVQPCGNMVRRRQRRATKRFGVFLVVAALIVMGIFFLLHAFPLDIGKAADTPDHSRIMTGQAQQALQKLEENPSLPATGGADTGMLPEGKDGSKEDGYLVLVNWDRPITSERPNHLVALSDVLSDAVTLEDSDGYINKTAGEAAHQMFLAAQNEGVGRYVINGAYRSVAYQSQLWQAQLKENPAYGREPFTNPVRAMPGNASEHSTGLAIDILSVDHDTADDEYGNTHEGKWLSENAWKFGFILRYPEDKEQITGVVYEPWHYRYVGKQAAKEIYESGLCLEEYLRS